MESTYRCAIRIVQRRVNKTWEEENLEEKEKITPNKIKL